MLIGLFTIKPVPLHPTYSHALAEGYDSVTGGDSFVFVGEAQVALDREADVEADADSAPLLSHGQESGSYQALPPSAVESNPPVSLHREGCVGDKCGLPDVHGKRLWATPDFYLVFAIMAICR